LTASPWIHVLLVVRIRFHASLTNKSFVIVLVFGFIIQVWPASRFTDRIGTEGRLQIFFFVIIISITRKCTKISLFYVQKIAGCCLVQGH